MNIEETILVAQIDASWTDTTVYEDNMGRLNQTIAQVVATGLYNPNDKLTVRLSRMAISDFEALPDWEG